MPLDNPTAPVISNDVIRDFMRQYRTQKRLCSEANGELRNIVKKAKSAGVNPKEMIASVNDTTMEPEVVAQNMRDGVHYRSLLGINTLTRTALFDGWDDGVTEQTQHRDDVWDAEDKGYKAGRAGVKADDCPYEFGSELAVHWRAEWNKGQASIARELGPNAKQADSSRARPKRGKSSEGSQPVLLEGPKSSKPAGRRSSGPKAPKAPRKRASDGAPAHLN